MVEVLSQDEIEALLAAMGSEPDEPAAPESTGGASATPRVAPAARLSSRTLDTRATVSYQAYDFRRPDKFSKDQMRTLQMLHETFGRTYSSSLSAYLRTTVHIELLSVEQIPYDEYSRSLSGNPLIAIFSLPPLSGQALMEADINIFFFR